MGYSNWLFFYGAQQNNLFVVGMVLKINNIHCYKLQLVVGIGSNTREELLALWGLLKFAYLKGIIHLMVVGDSKCIVDWASGKYQLNIMILNSWKENILQLKSLFQTIHFMHVHRHFNGEVDHLSKEALLNTEGFMFFEEYEDREIVDQGSLLFY